MPVVPYLFARMAASFSIPDMTVSSCPPLRWAETYRMRHWRGGLFADITGNS
jgi:hypothetical protein